MAVDTPVLDRVTVEEKRKYSVPSRLDVMAEEEHNARIKDHYARLINPKNRIEDVFDNAEAEEVSVPVAEPVQTVYQVENARAKADIFRADSAINAQRAQTAEVMAVPAEEENEDLRPTPTTIQYQTIGVKTEEEAATAHKSTFVFGKREKIIVAVFVAVVIALMAIVIVNATIISNLNAEISTVQESITTVKGAIAGVNSSVNGLVEEIITNGAQLN